jgi:hypothetical protein
MFKRIRRTDLRAIEADGESISRRGMLGYLGKGAGVGVGLAAGGALLGAGRASAGTDGDVVLDAENYANGMNRTAILESFSGNEVFGVFNNASTGAAIRGRAESDAGYWVSDAASSPIGVYGESHDGFGVIGRSVTTTGVLGTSQSGSGVRALNNSSANPAIYAENDGTAEAVAAQSVSGIGVHGISSSTAGVFGESQSEGVYAQSGFTAGTNPGTTRSGVHGVTDSATDSGVWGEAVGGGAGVTGSTTGANGGVQGLNHGTGPGVLAQNTAGGTALQVSGPAAFSRSGAVSIPATKASAKVSGLALGPASLVLATIQANVAGVYVQGVTVVAGTSGSFTVHLNKATPSALQVAWFVLN